MKSTADQFHPMTIDYLNNSDLKHRKKLGQYFTPKDIRRKLILKLPLFDSGKILDPACGTGEFLISASEHFPNSSLTGWDIDKKLISIAKKTAPTAKITAFDALKYKPNQSFDLIIGNPPYFEFKPDDNIKDKFSEIISGRCNIFSTFIKLGLDLLSDGGHLAYVVPPSMNNGAYFKKLREYIIRHGNIEYLKILPSPKYFDQAQQSVMLIIIKKGANRNNYIFQKNGLTLFSPDSKLLNKAFKNKTTLFGSGFKVKTGQIIWNQNRGQLTNSAGSNIPLIWSHNIQNSEIILKKSIEKPQYVKSKFYNIGPAIVVNRITGSSGNSSLKAALIESGKPFLAENHVNVITPTTDQNHKNQTAILKKIVAQLSSKEMGQIASLITGNTQISKTELWKLLPFEL